MAIGTTAAIIGSAVIGAGASAMASSKNSKAINQSTQAQTQANQQAIAAQQQARSENMALQSPIYQAGLPAMQARNSMLGLSQPAPQQTTQQMPNALMSYGYEGMDGPMGGYRPENMAGDPLMRFTGAQQGMGQGMPAQQAAPQVNGQDAFKNYIANSDYAFQFGEGSNGINSGYAGAGTLQSGAAMKALEGYRQNLQSGYRNEFMGYLGDQQMLAAGAANAMSGVNTNYANSAGNLAMANANNITNSAVAKANNSNAMLGSIGNIFGSAMGQMGSSNALAPAWSPSTNGGLSGATGSIFRG